MKTRNPEHHKNTPSSRGRESGMIWLYGTHPVIAALRNPNRLCRRLIMTAEVARHWQMATPSDPPKAEILDRRQIDQLLPPGAVHQGVALQASPLPDLDIQDTCQPTPGQSNILVVLDQVTDPHNVGAILRSAAAFGAKAMILTDRNAPEETGILAKSASGALELVPLVRVTNLARALDEVAELGYWRLGLEGDAEKDLVEVIPEGGQNNIALVLGAEGAGMRRLTAERCDFTARLPIRPEIESLNVSNAAACALYELTRK